MNGRPFRIAAAGLCTALLASIVAGVSHFRTESLLIAGTERLPLYIATIAVTPTSEAGDPSATTHPFSDTASLNAPELPRLAATDLVAGALPPVSSEVNGRPDPSWSGSRPSTNVVSNVRRKKEFIELPPPDEFLNEPDEAGELVVAPLPVRTTSPGSDPRILAEIASLRHEFERIADQQRLERDSERDRQARQLADLSTEHRLLELKSSIDDLKSSRIDQRVAMLQIEPATPVLVRNDPPPEQEIAASAEPTAPVTPEPPPPLPAHPSIQVTPADKPDQFHIRLDAADLHAALAEIGQRGSMNLVISPDVRGTITASWKNMTLQNALDAIRLAHGLTVESQGAYLLVSSAAESRDRAAASKNTIVQMFRPLYVSGRDLLPLIEPLLTPDVGRVAVTKPQSSAEAQQSPGGGDSLAQPDAIIVVDYPDVVEIVTRTIAEIDVPAPHVELEATILDVQLSGRVKNGVSALLASGEFSNRPGFASLDAPEQLPCDSCCQTCDLSCADLVQKLRLWTDVKLVSNARLLVLNKQPAELNVGTESITMLPTGPTMPSASVDNVTRLFVRPFVSADHLVRLEVSPEAMTARMQSMNIRRESFASVGTNVTVPNGGSLVIAGLNVDESVAPSALFQAFGRLKRKHRDEANRATRRELVILITPRIIPECAPVE